MKEKVPCPMCYRKFDSEHIETHAAECQGEAEGEECLFDDVSTVLHN